MRDYIVLVALFLSLPLCFMRPHMGVLVWILISLMNPHRMTWGAQDFPIAMVAAVATLAGFVFARGKRPFPWCFETVLLLILFAYFTLTTLSATNPTGAWLEWQRLAKTYLMVFVTLSLFQNQARLRLFLLVVAVSIAVFGVKGAIFAIRTGGEYIVFGPRGSFIADNNALALAELMVIPLLLFLAQCEPHRWVRHGLNAAAGLSILAVVFSYSRGAFVAMGGLAMAAILLSQKRWRYLALTVLFALVVLPVVPQKWHERMGTIQTYEEDPSAMGRINAWHFAYNLALDRPFTGGGFRTFREDLFLRYAPDPFDVHDAHSIYFEVLAEHGFVALGLFLLLLFGPIVGAQRLKRVASLRPDLAWAGTYATALQLSLIAYAIGGAFLGLAYFDLYYYLIAAVACLKVLVRERLAEPAEALEPANLQMPTMLAAT